MNTEDEWKPADTEDPDEISLDGVTGLHRCHERKPYTYHRLMRILADNGLKAEKTLAGI